VRKSCKRVIQQEKEAVAHLDQVDGNDMTSIISKKLVEVSSSGGIVRIGRCNEKVRFDGTLGEVLIPVEGDAATDLDEGGVPRTHRSFWWAVGG
jgi:hypothetical protein